LAQAWLKLQAIRRAGLKTAGHANDLSLSGMAAWIYFRVQLESAF